MSATDLSPASAHLDRIPNVIDEIAAMIASKMPIWEVARHYGVTQSQMMRWVAGNPDRMIALGMGIKASSHNMVVEAFGRVSEVVAIADEQNQVERLNADGSGTGEYYDPDVPRDRLRVDGRLKAAKLMVDFAGIVNPKDYGPKQQVNFSGTLSLDAVLTAMESGAAGGRVVGHGSAE